LPLQVLDQVGDDFGIRLRRERVSLCEQLDAQRGMVLDDAVVHHRDIAGDMRMRVTGIGCAMRGPAGVRNA
jgi:hypothetical protein